MNKRNIAGLLLALINIWSCQKDDSTSTDTGNYQLDSDYSVAALLAANATTHESATDYSWDAYTAQDIVLNGNSITATVTSVTIDGATATISEGGNYRITGTLTNGQIRIATGDNADPVRLILDGAHITNSNSAAIYVINASKTIIVLADESQNSLTDGTTYVFDDATTREPDATLFSSDALTITGNGTLDVNANYADAITSKDGLILAGGNLNCIAKDDAIRGKDYVVVKGAKINATATGDGLKSDNDTDASRGYVYVAGGAVTVTAGADAVQAATDVLIADGSFAIKTTLSSGATAKGLKAGKHLVIDNGTFVLNTADDALHSNNNLCVNDGQFSITSQDDGIHADTSVSINGGDITIIKSYEGIESRAIAINGGTVHLTATDDGLNAAGGNDGSASQSFPGLSASSNTGYFILITGGFTSVTATGDGVDANGAISMTGGTLLVNGPTAQNNGALDYDVSFNLTGGLLVAVGSSGMAQAPGSGSTQYSMLAQFDGTVSAGSLVHLETTDGTEVLTFKPSKVYQTLVFSSPALQRGVSYRLYTGGGSTGTVTDGLYSEGTYTPGNAVADFTINNMVTKVQ